MRLLAIDIETSPIAAYTFSLFRPVIGHKQIIEDPRIICFSYQWQGEKSVKFVSEFHDGREQMLATLWDLLDEADVLLHYNGSSFDRPWIEGELLAAGYTPPSPSRDIDLFQTIKRRSRFPSKKLDYVAGRLLDEQKVSHTGIELWIGCLNGDEKSWNLMRRYAKKDTALLFPLYEKLKPWIKNHPNVNAYSDRLENACPVCGGTDYQRRGYSFTSAGKYPRFQCNADGKWWRGKSTLPVGPSRNI